MAIGEHGTDDEVAKAERCGAGEGRGEIGACDQAGEAGEGGCAPLPGVKTIFVDRDWLIGEGRGGGPRAARQPLSDAAGVGQPVAVQRAIEGAHESEWPSPPGARAETVVDGELIWYQQLSLKPGEGVLLGEANACDEYVGLREQREPLLGAAERSTGLAELSVDRKACNPTH